MPAIPQVEEPAVAPFALWPVERPETAVTVAIVVATVVAAAASSVAAEPSPGWMPLHPYYSRH